MILVSFGDRRWRFELQRLEAQANQTGLYRKVLMLTTRDLDSAFRRRHRSILNTRTRGFGYYIWKPQVVLQALSAAQEGEIVHFLDAGFHINPSGVTRLGQYRDLAADSPQGVLAFKLVTPEGPSLAWDGRPLPHWSNRMFTKRALLNHLGLDEDEQFLDAAQHESGAHFWRACPTAVEFANEWLSIMEENYAFIDDSQSPGGELPGFVAHRHDQSVFSAIAERHQFWHVSSREFWYPCAKTGRPDWSEFPHLPLQARRSRPKRKKPLKRVRKRAKAVLFRLGRWIRE